MSSLGRSIGRRTRRRVAALAATPGRYACQVLPLELTLVDGQLGPAVGRWLEGLAAAPHGRRLCLCCGEPFRAPRSVALVDPVDRRGPPLIAGLCSSCAAADGLKRRVELALEEQLGLARDGWLEPAAGHA